MEKIMSASIWREHTALERRDETSDASVPRRRDGTRKRSNLGTMDRTTDKREARLRSVSKIWIKTSGNQIRKPRRLGSTLQIFPTLPSPYCRGLVVNPPVALPR
jgi:hypothetical protein